MTRSHNQLRSWASNIPVINSGDHNEYVPFTSGNVFAYACTDDHDGSNFFNAADVDAAYATMDATCPPYTSSYAIYAACTDRSCTNFYNTGKIIGKDVSGHPVCQGHVGN